MTQDEMHQWARLCLWLRMRTACEESRDWASLLQREGTTLHAVWASPADAPIYLYGDPVWLYWLLGEFLLAGVLPLELVQQMIKAVLLTSLKNGAEDGGEERQIEAWASVVTQALSTPGCALPVPPLTLSRLGLLAWDALQVRTRAGMDQDMYVMAARILYHGDGQDAEVLREARLAAIPWDAILAALEQTPAYKYSYADPGGDPL